MDIFFNSFLSIRPVTIAEDKSAIGKDIQIPMMPINLGNIKTKGIKNKTCLDKDRIRAGIAFPID
jgi:hypothetical protein